MNGKPFLWFGAFVAVVALAGAATGVLIDRYLLPPREGRFAFGPGPRASRGPMARPVPGGGGGLPGWLSDRLTQDLGLSAAQREKLDGILASRRSKLDEVRAEIQARMQAQQHELRAEIRAILDAKQQQRFDELMANTPGLFGPGPGQRGMRRGQMPRPGVPPPVR